MIKIYNNHNLYNSVLHILKILDKYDISTFHSQCSIMKSQNKSNVKLFQIKNDK